MQLISSIGLMSGTSMDGIDGSFIFTNGRNITNNHFSSRSKYKKETLNLLNQFIDNPLKLDKANNNWKLLNQLVTNDHANLIEKILNNNKIKPDVIGFHGQTIYHNPKKKISIQVGSPEELKKMFGITVVSNFRLNDIKNGGEGAPLAPIYHKSLIKKLNLILPACFVNIGGVSNLTYWDGDKLIGFDTGPGNGLMDRYTKKYLNIPYDKNGLYASKGNVSIKLIREFMKNRYFFNFYPKSLDNLFFIDFLDNKDFKKLSINDALATLGFITIKTILESIKMLPKVPRTITLMGGGQFNNYIVNQMIQNTSVKIQKASELNLNAQMIEPELMGYLAVRKLLQLPSTFPLTTGVNYPTICGQIF